MSTMWTIRKVLCALTVALVAGSTASLTFADDLPGIGHTVPLTRLSFRSEYRDFPDLVFVGGDPGVFPPKTVATTIKAVVIPLVINIGGTDGQVWTFDPTQQNPCDGSVSAEERFKQSPLVQPTKLTFNSVTVGTFQYIPGYKRAAFWNFLNGRNVEDTIDWQFPLKSGFPFPPMAVGLNATIKGNASNCTLRAQTSPAFISQTITDLIIPFLQGAGILSPDQFALFITRDVVESDTGGGTTGGSHGHTPGHYDEKHPPQTYAWAEYNSTTYYIDGPYARGLDIFSLSHEIGEWMMDPLNNNDAPSWTNPQSGGCSTKFEVGDPMHGTNNAPPIFWNGYPYHTTELAFFSWFYNKTLPSFGAGGAFSSYGTFTKPHAPCH